MPGKCGHAPLLRYAGGMLETARCSVTYGCGTCIEVGGNSDRTAVVHVMQGAAAMGMAVASRRMRDAMAPSLQPAASHPSRTAEIQPRHEPLITQGQTKKASVNRPQRMRLLLAALAAAAVATATGGAPGVDTRVERRSIHHTHTPCNPSPHTVEQVPTQPRSFRNAGTTPRGPEWPSPSADPTHRRQRFMRFGHGL